MIGSTARATDPGWEYLVVFGGASCIPVALISSGCWLVHRGRKARVAGTAKRRPTALGWTLIVLGGLCLFGELVVIVQP
ncbi:MAG: hypothetical protein ACR2P2_09030 [Nakamurella sp.]